MSGRNRGRNGEFSKQLGEENGNTQKESVRSRGRIQGRGKDKKPYDKRKVQYYTCEKFGHYSYEWWNNDTTKTNKKGGEAHLAQYEGNSD